MPTSSRWRSTSALCAALHVPQQIGGIDLHGGVVDPLVRVADLGAEGVQLLQRFELRCLAHPVQPGDGVPVGRDQVGHEGLHARLVAFREVPGHVDLADRLTEGCLDHRDAALPAVLDPRRPAQGGAVEREVRVHERGRQVRGGRADDAHGEPFLPGGQRFGVQQRGRAGEEIGRAHHEFGALLRHDARGVEPVGQQREQLGRILGGLQVVRLLRIPQRHVVPVVRGQRSFQRHHASGRTLGVGHVRQAQHGRHVRTVGLDHRGELLLPVIRLIGQAEAALARVEQDPVRVSGIRCRVDVEKPRHVGAEQPSGQRHESGHRRRGEHLRQPRPDRIQALGLHRRLVHEAVVQVPDLPLDAGSLCAACGRLLDNLLHGELRSVAQRRKRALQRPVVRNDRALEPAAVHVLVQVILRADAGVDGGQIDPRKWHGCSFERQPGTGACGGGGSAWWTLRWSGSFILRTRVTVKWCAQNCFFLAAAARPQTRSSARPTLAAEFVLPGHPFTKNHRKGPDCNAKRTEALRNAGPPLHPVPGPDHR